MGMAPGVWGAVGSEFLDRYATGVWNSMSHTSKLAALAAFGLAMIAGDRSDAGSVVYDNGPINGNLTAWTINTGFEVSDSFTVTAATELEAVQIGLWVVPGDIPESVQWSIGTSAYGSDVSFGSADFSNNFVETNMHYHDVYVSTFSVNALIQPGTTYWLTLQGATTHEGLRMYWDENGGPSTGYSSMVGNLNGFGETPGTHSESFQIYGSQAVPEPSSFVLAAMGCIGGLGTMFLRRRRGRTAA